MIKFNVLALIFLIAAAAVAHLARFALRPGDDLFLIQVLGALLILADGAYRLRQEAASGRAQWLSPRHGAFVGIMPGWALGLAFLIVALAGIDVTA